jgi:AhpD family alkylhydroperoxidase
MSKSYREIAERISTGLLPLRAEAPEVMKAFGGLAAAATRDGALSRKTKELMALALGVAAHCDGCIAFHMQTLVKLGVTRAEVDETLSIAIYMGGGPSLMYAADALSALEEFSAASPAAST